VINNAATTQRNDVVYLTGLNSAGSQYWLKPQVSGSGYLQKFTFK
jgi:hypothetical protein